MQRNEKIRLEQQVSGFKHAGRLSRQSSEESTGFDAYQA
jgi:hypothetical protein